MALSLSQQEKNIQNKIQAVKTYNDISNAEKDILSKAGNSFSNVGNAVSSQLNKVSEQQKRFQRDLTTSSDRLINMLQSTMGSGTETFSFLRKIFLQTLSTIEPEISKILSEETLKALGCSQEQTYSGINPSSSSGSSLNDLPDSQGIYVPVKNIDIAGNLKIDPNSLIGKLYYENQLPTGDDSFVPYGGPVKFPTNRMLHDLTKNAGQTYEQKIGKFYNGKSGQNLFDVVYTNKNNLGVDGDYFRIFLLEREQTSTNPVGTKLNFVGQFINDYYSTIQIINPTQILGSVINMMTGFVSIEGKIGFKEIEEQNKFILLIQRILGLCFDDREQIDVSGIAKIAELDGIDDSFFELTDVDLRNIELAISNIQRGVVVFQDCDNIELPVNSKEITGRLVDLSSKSSGMTKDEIITESEKILDSLSENKEWKLKIPDLSNLKVAVDRDFLKKLPIAITAGVLTPKVLFPIVTLLYELERLKNVGQNSLANLENKLVQSAETYLQSGNTLGQEVSSVVNNQADFVKKNKTFVISVATRINGVFIERLFEVLKVEIFNLISVIIKDIQRSQTLKTYAIILRLVQVGYVLLKFVQDYKKCKSLLDEISLLLSLIGSYNAANLLRIPSFLNLFAALLPGFSSERATVNVLEKLQELGIPTGPLPGGGPNQMNLFIKSLISGIDQEESENGKVETSVLLPPPLGLISSVGKKN